MEQCQSGTIHLVKAYMSYKTGEYTYGTPIVYQWTDNCKLTIGKFCSIADNVRIVVDGTHRTDWVSSYHLSQLFSDIPNNPGHALGKGDMTIGNDVWIGIGATILPGVSIGNGATIGAGSVVTRNVLPYEVVAGNPAERIRFRFTDEQIDALQIIAWWNWGIGKIRSKVNELESTDIDSFIKNNL